MKIKQGQSVNWNGDFGSHPIAAFGGDSPNPIDVNTAFDNDAGSQTVTAAFPNVGTFGYHCEIHPAMLCAIQVVP